MIKQYLPMIGGLRNKLADNAAGQDETFTAYCLTALKALAEGRFVIVEHGEEVQVSVQKGGK